jgi:hypothetical protein
MSKKVEQKTKAQIRAEKFLAQVREIINPEFDTNISGPVIRVRWECDKLGKNMACYIARSRAHGFELSFSQKNGLYELLGQPEARRTKRHYNVAYKELGQAIDAIVGTNK